MENTIFKQSKFDEIANRITELKADNKAVWGTMNVLEMMQHCIEANNMALDKLHCKRIFIGRFIGKSILKKIMIPDVRLKKNSPTATELMVSVNASDFEIQLADFQNSFNQFKKLNTSDLEGVIHPFFGKMTGEEWGVLVYKHLDHHLRQFSV